MIGRLTDLVPEEPPARLHGDLWNGNVLWGLDGQVWLIDPAAYGGHREVDLAMLSLFGHAAPAAGARRLRRGEPAGRRLGGPGRPAPALPAAGARLLFGGGYGARAAEAASRYACDRARASPALSAPAQARLAELSRDHAAPGRRPRVLVVDDDKAVRESLRRSLEFNGYDVVAGRRRRRGAGRAAARASQRPTSS